MCEYCPYNTIENKQLKVLTPKIINNFRYLSYQLTG